MQGEMVMVEAIAPDASGSPPIAVAVECRAAHHQRPHDIGLEFTEEGRRLAVAQRHGVEQGRDALAPSGELLLWPKRSGFEGTKRKRLTRLKHGCGSICQSRTRGVKFRLPPLPLSHRRCKCLETPGHGIETPGLTGPAASRTLLCSGEALAARG